jgi:glycosyltransferase involved in cell wall biosynthesis
MTETTYPITKDVLEAGRAATEGPMVSAIIPTHNRAAMLSRAIRSVQSQTYPHFEIIVVDDASQDSTREVVESFHDPRIRYIRHDTNKGGSAARNTGIRAATGEFIAFLDDDDEWEPEKTEEQLEVLKDCDAVTCTSDTIGDDLTRYNPKETVELKKLLRGEFTFGGTGVLMAKASVLKETMFDESLPRYQDWDLFIRIALKYRITYLNKPLLRAHSGDHLRITNSIRNLPIAELEQRFRMLHKHKKLFGTRWFNRHMCNGLLYGIGSRQNKIALLLYTARRYGLIDVVRALVSRITLKLRGSISSATPTNQTGVRRSKS